MTSKRIGGSLGGDTRGGQGKKEKGGKHVS